MPWETFLKDEMHRILLYLNVLRGDLHNGWGGQTKKMYRKGRVNIVYFKALTLHGIYLMQKKGRKLGS